MAVTLRLGSVTFSQFEIPTQINFGGKQALTVHKLPGGERIIDAMGYDEDDITWSGRFRGNQAVSRARAVDRMRLAGLPVTLTWGNFRYQVLVESFKADFRQAYEIDYSVSCVVLRAFAATLPADPLGLGSLLNIDLSQLTAISDTLNLPAVSAVINEVQSTLGEIGAFSTLPSEATDAIASAIGGATGTVLSTIGILTDTLSPDAGMSGIDAISMAGSLVAEANAFSQLADLTQLGSTLGRMGRNLAA